jgi:phosphoglucomutase
MCIQFFLIESVTDKEGVSVTPSRSRYLLWSRHPYFDEATRQALSAIEGDEREIEDRFYTSLQFGTGGLRGLIGPGTNRINRYVIRHVTRGLADYINATAPDGRDRGVVIAHDSRHYAREFALETALTLNASGIKAYLWDSLRPTPLLSFAVRTLGAIAGVVITASHNPPEYNGYKVYWADGGQVPPERAAAIQAAIDAISEITEIDPMGQAEARAQGLLLRVPPAVDRQYLDRLKGLLVTTAEQRQACHILYTPLHGAGNKPVRQVLNEAGYHVSLVPKQVAPDPDFTTVRFPNPEEPEVFALALQQAATEQPDLIIATDPDADRLGALALDHRGGYRHLTGNQIGALLVDFLLSTRPVPANAAVIKTIATSDLIAPLCAEHGVALISVHTGFKFIGDKIREFEESGSHTFLFGFEESYGYLGATFVRDKDAVMAALLLAEAAAFHKACGRTLYEALERIWQKCGCFQEDLHSVTLPGKEGQAQMAALMDRLGQTPPAAMGGLAVRCVDDYRTGIRLETATGRQTLLDLAKANVLHYRFANGGFVMVRPSGTEPKLKLYFSVRARDPAAAHAWLQAVKQATLQMIGLV